MSENAPRLSAVLQVINLAPVILRPPKGGLRMTDLNIQAGTLGGDGLPNREA